MTHESVKREPADGDLLTRHEGDGYEPDCFHDCKHVVAARETGRWITLWDPVDVEAIR